MKDSRIFVLDSNTHKWVLQHVCSFAEKEFVGGDFQDGVVHILVVGDELFAMAMTSDNVIFQSERFGGKNL